MREWWKGAVIYQIYPRSFQDDSGDGIGDLRGIVRRLAHVASLGVDAIWIGPIFPSPQKDMGYDVADYCDIDPMFGTLADFDTLVEAAHGLGLKVILDQVLSHSSDRHPWFRESRRDRDNPKADWYVWADPRSDGSPPNNWLSVFGGPAWEWDTRRRQYYLHHFLPEQPDLNFHQPEVQEAQISTLRFWLERGVDGFRLDTVNYYFHDRLLRSNPALVREKTEPEINPNDMQLHRYSKTRPENLDFLRRLRALSDASGGRAILGEVGESGARMIRTMADYTRGTRRLHMAYSFGMLGPEFSPGHFRAQVEGFFRGAPGGWPCWSFSNHDVTRHVSRWKADGLPEDALARLGAALLASFEGTVCLYQGEELGQTDTDILWEELTDPPGIRFWPDYKGRDGCRTPMVWDGTDHGGFTTARPWLPVKAPQLARNVAAQEADPNSVLHAYRGILGFRRGRTELAAGRSRWLDLPEPLLGFHRESGGSRITCLFNLGPEPAALAVAGPAAMIGPGRLGLSGGRLTLPGCGYGWLHSTGREAPALTPG